MSSSKNISLVWNGNMFILIRSDNDYLYSYDGQKWIQNTDVSNSSIITQNSPLKVKWTGSQFLVTGNIGISQGNTLLKSNDGIHYEPFQQLDTIPYLNDIEANLEFSNTILFPRNMMVALGGSPNDTTKIAYSIDEGINWIPSSNSSFVFTETANNAFWNGKIWVAVGKGNNTIATSIDGINWIGRGSYIFSNSGNCIQWNLEQAVWIAGGSGTNSLAMSYDGIYWKEITNPFLESTNSILWNGILWVATGIPKDLNHKSIIYSYDGINWLAPEQTDLFDTQGTKLSWNGCFWTAIGSSQNNKNIATSNDGINWNLYHYSNIPLNLYVNSLKTFLIDGSYSLLLSDDNNILDGYSISLPITTPNTIFYNDSYYLIGGEGDIIKSIDGFQWTNSSTIQGMSLIKEFAWNSPNRGTPQIKPMTIALGEGTNTLGYSLDGIYWKGLGNQVFTVRGNKAVWNGSIWVSVGSGHFWVATSYDGKHWIGCDKTIMSEGLDVAWNGTVFIAVGYGGTHKFAASKDGISWYGLDYAEKIFSLKASSIVWTGKIWLAYGSGGNTTAYSTSQDGFIWEPTVHKNQVIIDASSIHQSAVSSSSVYSELYDVSNVFDVTLLGKWRSLDNIYDSSNGQYVGDKTTLYDLFHTASGEWIQIMTNSPQKVVYYNLVCSQEDVNSGTVPKEWFLLGSNNGEKWDNIDYFCNNTIYSINKIRNIYSNKNEYTHYRFVFPSVVSGTYISVSKIELFYENNQSTILDSCIKPIVTKTNILYQNNMISSLNGTRKTLYQVADLNGNIIGDSKVNLFYMANNIIDSSRNQLITSSCFDGYNHIITSYNGELYNITNESMNTNLEIIDSSGINTNIQNILTSCFNGQRIILGGMGGNVITYSSPLKNGENNFHNSLNGNLLFNKINGLASNSGYGFLNIPNKIYLKTNEKISVVGPKTYNKNLSQKNMISISLNSIET